MGANFIGWHAKGPARLNVTDEQIQQLASQLLPVARWWRDLGDDRESKYFDHLHACELTLTPEAANQLDFVDSFLAALEHDGDDAALGDHVRELVAKTLTQWPPDYRDVSCEIDPDDPSQVIVFAGDRIWGDEPYGNGYLALRMLAQTGIGTAVGIKLLEGFVALNLFQTDLADSGGDSGERESIVEVAKSHEPVDTDHDRILLLRGLYQVVVNATESFEENDIGADMAYLMGAILERSRCDWLPDRPLVQTLREHFSSTHRLWKYISIQAPA